MSLPTEDRTPLHRASRAVLAVIAVAIAARLSFPVPGTPVPQSAQTIAVLMVGWWLGARDGALALLLYLVLGALGLPIFSDGGSGWPHLTGPTGGYLVGFVLTAAGVGHAAESGRARAFWVAAAVMVGAHVLILAIGWARLALVLGPSEAYEQGVAPFLIGGVVKGVITAGIARVVPGSGPRVPS